MTRLIRLGVLVCASACVLFFANLAEASSYQATAEPIPQGFDFPAEENVLLGFRDNDDIRGMRVHAWNVFAGMTQPATGGEAIWETWFRSDETFDQGPAPAGPRVQERRFSPPRQFQDPDNPQAAAAGESLLSFVMFNKESHDFIREKEFYKRSKLTAVNNGFPASTPLPDRKIEDFPRTAMSLKTVWWRVRKNGITPLPIWDFQPVNEDADGNSFQSWRRIVGVDPSRDVIPAGETASLVYPEPPSGAAAPPARNARVVPLKDLYHFKVTAANVGSFASVPRNSRPEVDDFVALVGLHYTTKEIPEWVWATFWWHDRPNNGPFGQDRIDKVGGVWRNYLMDVAFSMDAPREFDGTANSCYNPWLEAGFSNGMQSNCMTCHQRALHPPVSFLPVTRGSLSPDDPFFRNRTKTDFLWSIPRESQ